MGSSIDIIPWKSVNGTRGISRAVTFDGVYRSISAQIIEALQQRCDERGIFRSLKEIDLGDRAKIERGPFSEFVCSIDYIKDDQRAWVLIDLLQQQTRTEVSLDDVSKIN